MFLKGAMMAAFWSSTISESWVIAQALISSLWPVAVIPVGISLAAAVIGLIQLASKR